MINDGTQYNYFQQDTSLILVVDNKPIRHEPDPRTRHKPILGVGFAVKDFMSLPQTE